MHLFPSRTCFVLTLTVKSSLASPQTPQTDILNLIPTDKLSARGGTRTSRARGVSGDFACKSIDQFPFSLALIHHPPSTIHSVAYGSCIAATPRPCLARCDKPHCHLPSGFCVDALPRILESAFSLNPVLSSSLQ